MVYNNSYKKRKPIYDETLGEAPTDEQNQKMLKQAKNVVTYWLERGDKTRQELFLKIKNKNITDEIANTILNQMEKLDYINDQRYAENFVYSKQTYDKLGINAIKYKLRLKGINQDIIDQVLAEVDEEVEEENAWQIALKKAKGNQTLETNKRIHQVAGILARKGYSGNLVFTLAKKAVEECPTTRN